MSYLTYIGAGALGLFFSFVGIVFALVSGPQFAYLIGGLLLVAHAGSIFYVVKKAQIGKGPQAAIVLVLPLFAVLVLGQIALLGGSAISWLMPDSEAFNLACKKAGAQYHKMPSQAVHSIAYDWTGNVAPPALNSYPHPPGIEFTERKRSDLEGRPESGPDGPYIRFPKAGPYYAINEFTADVLVKTNVDPEEELRKAPVNRGPVTYDVLVTDRRTSEQLATLRYAIDAKSGRICGLPEGNKKDLSSFVLKSIGVH
jgi:hypothetical protein